MEKDKKSHLLTNRESLIKFLYKFYDQNEEDIHIVDLLHRKLGTEETSFYVRHKAAEYLIAWCPNTVYFSEKKYEINRPQIEVVNRETGDMKQFGFIDCFIHVIEDGVYQVMTPKYQRYGSESYSLYVDKYGASGLNTVENHEDDYNVGETSDRWNTLNTKENTTMKEWHDTQKAAESIVKKLDTYYLNTLKQKIADYSHFTIDEFHELASELLLIQYAEEEKQVEQERVKELEEERESEALRKGNKRPLLSEKDSLLANALIHISLNFNEATDKSEDFLSEVRQLINRYTYNSGEFSKFFDLSFVDDEDADSE